MTPRRHFASDNNAGVHPEVWRAMQAAGAGHVPSYGHDELTARVERVFSDQFGRQARAWMVFTGTAANVIGLESLTRPHHAVICAEGAHIAVDECGAPERFTGCKLIAVPTVDGKLRPTDLPGLLTARGDEHRVQPSVVSISQATEVGTVYTVDEVRALASAAHGHGLTVHMDGARIANAAAFLDVPMRAFTTDAGVDVLSFGGTKNGLLAAEAVVLLQGREAGDLPFVRKQGMQLASKMRFMAAQFLAYFDGDLWRRNAEHANRMARRLADGVRGVRGIVITRPVEANGVFARVPPEHVPALQDRARFYVWDATVSEVRWMTAWDTTEEDVDGFVAAVREIVK
jgi:threonine aldolase